MQPTSDPWTSSEVDGGGLFRRTFVLLILATILVPHGLVYGAESAKLKLWVVEASAEQRDKPIFDKGLESIQRMLTSLPHDTFRKVGIDTHSLADSGATRIALTATYTLETAMPEATQDGRYRIRLRILMKSSDQPPKEIEALSTELLLHTGKEVLVRGLKLKEGKELVLVMTLSVPKSAAS